MIYLKLLTIIRGTAERSPLDVIEKETIKVRQNIVRGQLRL